MPLEKSVCPFCIGELVYRDSRLRKSKDVIGNIISYLLRRLRCESCKKLHTEIPDILQPYKHYDSKTIQSVIDENSDASFCVADDSSIRRWKKSFKEAAPDVGQRVASVYVQAAGVTAPVHAADATLAHMRTGAARWLAAVMKLLINSGHKLCTRFAFCPYPFPDKVKGSTKNDAKGGMKIDKTIKDSG